MNAYELADYFENQLNDVFPYCVLTISLLRQQADRIAELEKELEITSKAAMDLREIHVNRIADLGKLLANQVGADCREMHYIQQIENKDARIAELEKVSSKPVAWWTGKFDDECEDFMFPDTRQAHIDHPQSETHNFFPIPLYTHPHKELSDEEIEQCFADACTEFKLLENGKTKGIVDIITVGRTIIKASRGEE